MAKRKIDLTGKEFHYLTVIKLDEPYRSRNGIPFAKWICKCKCGSIISVRQTHLVSGSTRSCGCYKRRIKNAPTIEAEPVKHGTWIDTPVPAENTFVAKCSVCGFWQKTNGEDKTGKHLIHKAVYRYCAGCGARMDAEDINVLTSDGGAENG